MADIGFDLTLEPQVLALAEHLAREQSKTVEQYLTDLVLADVKQRREALAAEGYQELAGEAQEFAAQSFAVGAEVWIGETDSAHVS